VFSQPVVGSGVLWRVNEALADCSVLPTIHGGGGFWGSRFLHNSNPIGRKCYPWRLCPHVTMIDQNQQLPSENSRRRRQHSAGKAPSLGYGCQDRPGLRDFQLSERFGQWNGAASNVHDSETFIYTSPAEGIGHHLLCSAAAQHVARKCLAL